MKEEEFILKLFLSINKATVGLIGKDYEVISKALVEENDYIKEFIIANNLFKDETNEKEGESFTVSIDDKKMAEKIEEIIKGKS